jgi:SulP family sulfate permease
MTNRLTTVDSSLYKSSSSLLAGFLNVLDERFEEYRRTPGKLQLLLRDTLAALVVALVAIPLNIGIAIASGMRPEQGIVAGAIACILGGLFGGSKYQIYGPTAAFITVIAGIVSTFGVPFLLLASIIAGVIVMAMGFLGLGKLFRLVPHSIVVGFTMGISATIIISQLPDFLGAHGIKLSPHALEKLAALPDLFQDANAHALVLGLITFIVVRYCYKISIYLPGPLIAIAVGTYIANFIWHDNFIPLISSKYGQVGANMFQFTLPGLGNHTVPELLLPVISIVFIAALESLLSSRMADRLADNPVPYSPNKELFGQGLINMTVPFLNGFPCTGAMARTATSIRVGAVSPLAAILKGFVVLAMMMFFAQNLSLLPMACVGGLLIYIAFNMVKPDEIRIVFQQGRFQTFLMLYTAVVTVCTDLMLAVASACVLHVALNRVFPMPLVSEAAVEPSSVLAEAETPDAETLDMVKSIH